MGAKVIKSKAFAADLLTEVDQQCEEAIEEIVKEHFPGHGFLGEETVRPGDLNGLDSRPGWLWVVDPIDGTTNFAAGQPMSAVSIGVALDGQLQVAAPCKRLKSKLLNNIRCIYKFLQNWESRWGLVASD